MQFTTLKDLESYIEDLMGSEGNREDAIKLTQKCISEGLFVLEWNGYFSTLKWDNDEYDFLKLWDSIE